MSVEPLSEDPGDEGDDQVVTPDNVKVVEEHELKDVPERNEDD